MERRREDRGSIMKEKRWIATGRTGAVELCKTVGTNSPASSCDPRLGETYIIYFCQEYSVALASWELQKALCTVATKGSPNICSSDAQKKRKIPWRAAQPRAPEAGKCPITGDLPRRKPEQQGEKMGAINGTQQNPCGTPSNKCWTLFQKQRSRNYRWESEKSVLLLLVSSHFNKDLCSLGKHSNNYYYYLPDNSNLDKKKLPFISY